MTTRLILIFVRRVFEVSNISSMKFVSFWSSEILRPLFCVCDFRIDRKANASNQG